MGQNRKTGLILEGGAMRGLFTAGILDVFLENGIQADGAVGVSAGAAFGCNYKSRQIGRALRYNLRFCRDKRYCSVRSLLKTGDLFGGHFCYHEIPESLDLFDTKTYRENPMEFHLVCTDVNTGRAVYRKCDTADYHELEWFRASASMPLVSEIVRVPGDGTADGYELLDGGIADSVPLRYFQSAGYEKNIVILTQPEGYVKKPNRMLPLMRKKYRKYPALLDAIAHRHEVYNETIAYVREEEKAGRVLVLCPAEKLPIGRLSHDPAELTLVYKIGRETVEAQLDRIRAFLEE